MTKFWVLYREPDAAEPTYWRTWGEWYTPLLRTPKSAPQRCSMSAPVDPCA